VSRNIPFFLRGTIDECKATVSSLFRILPERLRIGCSYFCGDSASESPISALIGVAHCDTGHEQIVFDLASQKVHGTAIDAEDSVFERTVRAATHHQLWNLVWPAEINVFHQLFELSSLLIEQKSFTGESTFTAKVARIFVDQNWQQIRQVLSRQLAEQAGSTLGPSLLNEGCFWLKDQLPDSITALKSGFPDQWLIEHTVAWLMNEQVTPLSAEQLTDIEKLQASAACEGSTEGWLLRTLFAGLAGRPELLISQMESLEKQDGEIVVEQLRMVIHRLHSELDLNGWRFTVETKNYSELLIGVQLQFGARTEGETSTQQTPLFAALFGCRVHSERPESCSEVRVSKNISGKFWPYLIEIIHTSFTPAVENLDVAN